MQVSAVKALKEVAFSDVSPQKRNYFVLSFLGMYFCHFSHDLSFALFFLHFPANVTKTITNQYKLKTD